MYTPPQTARGSISPRPCAPPGLVESLPGDLTLDSIPQQTPVKVTMDDKERKEAFMSSCRKHLGTAYRSIECEYEKLHRNTEG